MLAHAVLWTFAVYLGLFTLGIIMSPLQILFMVTVHYGVDILNHPFEKKKGIEAGFDFYMHILQLCYLWVWT